MKNMKKALAFIYGSYVLYPSGFQFRVTHSTQYTKQYFMHSYDA